MENIFIDEIRPLMIFLAPMAWAWKDFEDYWIGGITNTYLLGATLFGWSG
jgi:hypothetical protein